MAILAALYRLALALWAGGMAIFTFVVTPVIFRTQGRDAAGRIVGALFPPYFGYCLVLSAAALIVRIAAGGAFRSPGRSSGTALLLGALALTAFQAYWIVPRMDGIRRSVASFDTVPPEDPARRAFSRLHGLSMALNGLVLLDAAALAALSEVIRG